MKIKCKLCEGEGCEKCNHYGYIWVSEQKPFKINKFGYGNIPHGAKTNPNVGTL